MDRERQCQCTWFFLVPRRLNFSGSSRFRNVLAYKSSNLFCSCSVVHIHLNITLRIRILTPQQARNNSFHLFRRMLPSVRTRETINSDGWLSAASTMTAPHNYTHSPFLFLLSTPYHLSFYISLPPHLFIWEMF